MIFFIMKRLPPTSPLFPYTTLFRSRHPAAVVDRGLHRHVVRGFALRRDERAAVGVAVLELDRVGVAGGDHDATEVVDRVVEDRKSTRLNSSHANISYAVFCLKQKKD